MVFDPTDPAVPAETKTLGDPALEATLPRISDSNFDLDERWIGRFGLLERLGEGGMGVVYAAYDPELDRKVALKFLHASESGRVARERLFREAQAMAKLTHPNVATVFDVGVERDQVFIAMQYIDGTTLKEWLGKEERPWAEIWRVFRQAAAGLAAAHDAGVVHRDFKPSNVLIDGEDCAHVVDFGLAHSSPVEGDDGLDADESPRLAQLTADGSISGTPGYMAPEQYRGEATNAASDQFAFCVSLYEALYKQLPFAGTTLGELAEATSSGELDPPSTSDVRVPAWIRRVLFRGLSPRAADRFPSMRALMDALDRDPAAVRRRRATAALVIGAFAGLFALAVLGQPVSQKMCAIDAGTLDDGWNSTGRSATRTAILATNVPRARQVWRRFEAAVDAYRHSWLEQWQSSCAATHVRHEQSAAVLDLRMECLAGQRRRIAATIDVVAHGVQPRELDKLIRAVSDLPLPAGCANIDNLRAYAPRPDDPAARERLASLEAEVGKAEAEKATGRLKVARMHLESLKAEASAVGYAPLEARIGYGMASIHHTLVEHQQSEKRIHEAVPKAVIGGDRELEARLWLLLAGVIGDAGRIDEARIALRAARASVLRAGSLPGLEAMVEGMAGVHDVRAGKKKDALAHWSRAARLWEAAAGPSGLAMGRALARLGMAQSWEHQAAGVKNARRGLAILENTLGRYHPDVAGAYRAVASAERWNDNHAAARDASRAAIEIFTHLLGGEHPQVAIDLSELGYALENLGDIGEAIRVSRRAVEITTKALGPGDRNVATFNFQLGYFLREAGRFEEAERAGRVALEVVRGYQKNKDHPDFARVELGLGWILLERGKPEEALALCTHAAAVWAKLQDLDQAARAHTCVGRARLANGEMKLAVRELDAAVKAAAAKGIEWYTQSSARFWLGQALWESGGDRTRAKTLVQQARQAHEANKYTWDVSYKRITAWLASHH